MPIENNTKTTPENLHTLSGENKRVMIQIKNLILNHRLN